MKNLLLLILLSTLISVNISGQCEFHEGLSLETALIYPLPFGVISEEEGGLGINKQAVVGSPFDFKWTMIWPDTFNNPLSGIAYADTIQFFLDRTIWVLEGDTVSIPEGLSFNITPENGTALPDSVQPVACILLNGTPSENVTPGDYFMTFAVRTCLTAPDVMFDGCTDAFIPGIIAGFPGEYKLTIKPTGTTSVKETLNNDVQLRVAPNPFSQETLIQFNAENLSNDYSFEVFDLNGSLIQSKKLNLKSNQQRIKFDASDLSSGVYVFQIKGKEGIITDRLVVQR
tara:strand:- start:139 stop:996 length:858 start_codon:yes stop_codon:yes gene_type:complete